MKLLYCLCLVYATAYCKPYFDDRSITSWDHFKEVYRRNYSSSEEENHRYESQDEFRFEI